MKIKCPSCGFENEKEARFCENCEEPLPNPYIKKRKDEGQSIKHTPDEEAKTKNRIEKEEIIRAEARVKAEKEIKEKEQKKQGMGFLIFLGVIILVAFIVFSGGDGENGEKQSVEFSIGYKLCVIDGDYEKEGSVKVRRYNYLLESLAQRCSCEEINIADMSVNAQKILREKYGKEVKNITLLEAANEDLAYGCSKDDFAKYMTLVIQVLKWQKFIFDKWKVDYSNLAVALEAKERNYKNILQGLKGVFTIRLFNKYSKNEENSIPEVHCYDLKSGEVDELLTLLEGIKFKYVSVDTKSIKAIKESNSREIYQARKKLEK